LQALDVDQDIPLLRDQRRDQIYELRSGVIFWLA
jgi:hypothetical protein